MTVEGVVVAWDDEEGWGVVDTPETPGGCWTHFSAVDVAGYRGLVVGQRVRVEWEIGEQDGYGFRAVAVRTPDGPPGPPPPARDRSAYRSRLEIRPDGPDRPD